MFLSFLKYVVIVVAVLWIGQIKIGRDPIAAQFSDATWKVWKSTTGSVKKQLREFGLLSEEKKQIAKGEKDSLPFAKEERRTLKRILN